MKQLQFLVTVHFDEQRLLEDNPPESIPQAIADEIKSNIESCRKVLGTDECVVQFVEPAAQ